MNEREALKLALEALESCSAGDYSTGHVIHPSFDVDAVNKAIDAVDEALALSESSTKCEETSHAQPEQEPVAWLIWLHGPAGHFDHKQFAEMEFERRNKEYPDPDRKLLPLYTTPPHRKPLTDEEFQKICTRLSRQGGWDGDGWDLALKEAIEAAHGIKE